MAEGNSSFDSGDGADFRVSPTTSTTMADSFSFSRTSSTGSIDILTSSSAQNTDDEDSDHNSTLSYKERRREAHTQAEQKRRDAIKRGYEELQFLVPTCQQQETVSSYKLSKATILQKSIDYIQYMIQQKKKQEEELNTLRKEVVALQIMKTNYEQIVRVHNSQPDQSANNMGAEVKIQLFQALSDSLFETFNQSLSVGNFSLLSGSVFSWLEEHCKPQALRNLALRLLRVVEQP